MTQAETIEGFADHGGRLEEARRRWPDAPAPWIDLSTGINSLAWRAPERLAIDAVNLPAIRDLRALEKAAAGHFEVDPGHLAAVPGSELALRLLPMLGLSDPIVAVAPCYGTHTAVATAASDRPGATLLLANPNNPDGRTIDPAALIDRARDRWLVVDEAFADATPEVSVLPRWNGAMNIVVLRSFGKFFGLAGVRLGFVVAPAAVLARLRDLLGDWPVSAHAIGWGRAAYGDTAWIDAARIALAERAARLDALLARHGLVAGGGSPLFRLVEHPDAQHVFGRLARAGILTRPFAYRRDWLRFGLPGDEAAFDRLDRALADG